MDMHMAGTDHDQRVLVSAAHGGDIPVYANGWHAVVHGSVCDCKYQLHHDNPT